MLLQIDQCKHNGDGKYRSESYAQFPAFGDALDGHVTGCCVDPGAVAEYDGFPLVEDEVAFRVVGDCVVAVKSVIPMSQGCGVEMETVDDGVGGVVALGKGEQVARHVH